MGPSEVSVLRAPWIIAECENLGLSESVKMLHRKRERRAALGSSDGGGKMV